MVWLEEGESAGVSAELLQTRHAQAEWSRAEPQSNAGQLNGCECSRPLDMYVQSWQPPLWDMHWVFLVQEE